MSEKQVTITFESVDEWQNQLEHVNKILVDFTGTDQYPATQSFPPIIFGAQLDDEGIGRLRAMQGVIVETPDE